MKFLTDLGTLIVNSVPAIIALAILIDIAIIIAIVVEYASR